ncbi:MAG TPA: Rid family detoxifying hydrolase [Tissierellaceae bacterium]|nr:Rid family detoxifying hydrolase [Tissierellaceae bacterium]
MTRKVYDTDLSVASGPYSQAVDAGDFVFVSGQTARNSKKLESNAISIKEQTQECFKLLFDILNSANLTPDSVVKVNVFLTDMRYFDEMNEVYKRQFSAPYPARTTVAVSELPLGADVEIELIARKK